LVRFYSILGDAIAAAFMDAVLNLPRVKVLLSDEHLSVDDMLIQAWAFMKRFRRKDGNHEPPPPGRNGERNFHKEKRSNQTHVSTTAPDARLIAASAGDRTSLPGICPRPHQQLCGIRELLKIILRILNPR
jgi:hypothetical protein